MSAIFRDSVETSNISLETNLIIFDVAVFLVKTLRQDEISQSDGSALTAIFDGVSNFARNS